MRHSGPWSASRFFLVFVAAVGAGGCPIINNDHCALNEGACGDGFVCSMCAADNNGCVALDVITDDKCMFASASIGETTIGLTSTTAPTTTLEPETTTTMGPTSSSSTQGDTTLDVTATTTTTTGDPTMATTMPDPDTSSTATTSEMECDPNFGNEQCGGMTPYCVDGDCKSCLEVPCSEVEPDKPACNEMLGACVQCVDNGDCGGSTPFCDPDSATCKACSMHEHCSAEFGGPDTACNLDDGVCFPADNVIWVHNTPAAPVGCANDNPGTEAEPLCLLSYGLAKATAEKSLTIKLRQGTGPQNENNIVKPDVDVAIVAADDTNSTLVRSGPEPALVVSPGARVYVHRLSMSPMSPNGTTNVVFCEAGNLWLDRVTIFSSKVGIEGKTCNLHLRRSAVFNNSTGGVTLDSSMLWMENSFITSNGMIFGLRLVNGSDANINYSTFALGLGTVAPIVCVNVMGKAVTIRNSFIADQNEDYFICPLEVPEDGTIVKTKFNTIPTLISNGFAASFTNGILRAQKDGELAGKAIWKDGDPRNDFDTDNIRPVGPDMADYAGADVP